MKNRLLTFAPVLFVAGLTLLPSAAMAQYSWHVIYRVVQTQPSFIVSNQDKQGGPFPTTQACFANQNSALQQIYTTYPGATVTTNQTLCSCNQTVASQGNNCPGYTPPTGSGTGSTGTGGSGTGSTGSGGSGTGSTGTGGSGTGSTGSGGTMLINPLGSGDLMVFLQNILKLVIRIGTIIIVLALVYVGFLFATTSVNPENKTKAREALLWTLVGALILLGAQAIAAGIEATVRALSS